MEHIDYQYYIYQTSSTKETYVATLGSLASKLSKQSTICFVGFSAEEQEKIQQGKFGKEFSSQITFVNQGAILPLASNADGRCVFAPLYLWSDALKAANEEVAFNVVIPEKPKQNWRQQLLNFTANVFSNSDLFYGNNQILNLKASLAKQIQNDFGIKANSFSKTAFWLYNASRLLGFTATSSNAGFKVQETPKTIAEAKLSVLPLFFKLRWLWYFVLPFAQFKQDTSSPLANGNHSLWRLSFGLLFMALLLVMPIASQFFGTTWDEPDNHAYAQDVLKFYASFGEDKSCFDLTKGVYSHLINYGLFFDTFAALVIKVSPLGVYETRHLLNALIGLLAIVFTGLVAKEMANWRAAFFAALLLFISPFFFGHSMNNPKDIPFAAGYIMSLYYIIKMCKQFPLVRSSTLFWLTISIASVISIRIGGLLVTGIFGLMLGLAWLIKWYQKQVENPFSKIPKMAMWAVVVAGASFFIGILPWPYGISAPFENTITALKSFTQFSNVTIYENFEGKRLFMNEVPWYYTPKLIYLTTPIAVLLGLAMGLFAFLKKGVVNYGAYWMMWFCVVFPIAYAAYGESTLYNSWRHFLFVYPPLVVAAIAGWELLMNIKPLRIPVLVVLALLVGKTTAWSIQHHPHNYVYYNELAGGYDKVYGDYEGDTYGNGLRYALDFLVEQYPEVTAQKTIVGTNFTPETGRYWIQQKTDSVVVSWLREYERFKKPWDYAILGTRTFSPEQFKNGGFPPKGTIASIDVDGAPIMVIVKRENNYFVDGYKAFDQQDFAVAAKAFEAYTQYDEANEEAWRMLGVSAMSMGDANTAKNALEKAISLDPESHIAYGYLGAFYMQIQDNQRALQAFEKAIDLKINYSFAYMQKGSLLAQLGQKREALIAFYQFLMAQASEQGKIHQLKGVTDLKRYEDVVNITQNVSPQILAQMGSLFLDLGSLDLAIRYFGYSVSINANYAPGYQGLAMAFEKQGNKAQAQQFMQKARELGLR